MYVYNVLYSIDALAFGILKPFCDGIKKIIISACLYIFRNVSSRIKYGK